MQLIESFIYSIPGCIFIVFSCHKPEGNGGVSGNSFFETPDLTETMTVHRIIGHEKNPGQMSQCRFLQLHAFLIHPMCSQLCHWAPLEQALSLP